ncbi:MAG: thiolase family protein [Solirubrobacterales bacterium]
MREVCIVGTSMIRFGRYPELDYTGLAVPAVVGALADAGATPADVEVAYCGHSYGGPLTGQRILRGLGMTGPPVINVENACSSGSTALREAWTAVGAGVYDVALVIGVDKLTQFGGGTLPLASEDWEVAGGMVMPAVYAMRAQRYMMERGATREDLAAVAVKARAHGIANPVAQMRKETTVEEVLGSRPIADPLTLFQCCPTGDGAAAAIVCAREVADRFDATPISILASGLHSGRYTPGHRDMATAEITVGTAKEAYEQAGVGPEDLDVVELHDAFTIAELMYYEALGLCEPGEAPSLLKRGETSLGGSIPVNPSGGLLAKGHPIGATGTAQLVEVVRQLQGRCEDRQIEGARVGLIHATGGGISGLDHGACSIHILAR